MHICEILFLILAELDSKEFTQTLFKLETNFKDINDEIMNKMKAEKAAALDEINLAGQKAAKATARLRSDAEAFAQKAKDQWADHYSRTEASLREKSDKSSTHVTHLQGKTGVARKIIQAGQSAAESTIENWRRADEKATRYNDRETRTNFFFSKFLVTYFLLGFLDCVFYTDILTRNESF